MKKLIIMVMLLAVAAFTQAQPQKQASEQPPDVYAVAYGKNATLTLYAVKDRCPGNTKLAVWVQYGVSSPGCWLWGSEDIMIKYWDSWNYPKMYRVKDFDKDPYYVRKEREELEKARKKK